MAFLRLAPPGDEPVSIAAQRLILRPPEPRDYPAWAALREASRGFLEPWEPSWTHDELSRAAFRRRLRHYSREAREGGGFAFFLSRREDGALLGGATLSNIRRGVAQTASLGYWIGARHARRGYMHEALGALLGFAFGPLGLHRVEAACITHNTPSRGLLERCGFHHEGQARAYLRIAGRWQDHLLYAILADDMERVGDVRHDRGDRFQP